MTFKFMISSVINLYIINVLARQLPVQIMSPGPEVRARSGIVNCKATLAIGPAPPRPVDDYD